MPAPESRSPAISIGLPVFNGENFLEPCIQSVLAQSFFDWELVICDNASIDGTAEICKKYAAQDDRIYYHRNDQNLGAAPNYNKTFHLATGELFKWFAHDDLLRPEYLEACHDALLAHPEAILCQTLVEFIDQNENSLGVIRGLTDQPAYKSVEDRFADFVLRPHSNMDFFSVIRRSVLENSMLHGEFDGADGAFVAELALKGPMLLVEQPLMLVREHEERYTQAKLSPKERQQWHNTASKKKHASPTLQLFRAYKHSVLEYVKHPADQKKCRRVLRKWWFRNWNLARIFVDWIAYVFPSFVYHARKFKQKLFSPPPRYQFEERD